MLNIVLSAALSGIDADYFNLPMRSLPGSCLRSHGLVFLELRFLCVGLQFIYSQMCHFPKTVVVDPIYVVFIRNPCLIQPRVDNVFVDRIRAFAWRGSNNIDSKYIPPDKLGNNTDVPHILKI